MNQLEFTSKRKQMANRANLYPKGTIFKHTEPGHERYLIILVDPKESICSGFDAKGHEFVNHKVYIGSRIMPVESKDLTFKELMDLEILINQ